MGSRKGQKANARSSNNDKFDKEGAVVVSLSCPPPEEIRQTTQQPNKNRQHHHNKTLRTGAPPTKLHKTYVFRKNMKDRKERKENHNSTNHTRISEQPRQIAI